MRKNIISVFCLGWFLVLPGISKLLASENADVESALQRFVDAWRGTEEMEIKAEIIVQLIVTGEDSNRFYACFEPCGSTKLFKGKHDDFLLSQIMDVETLKKLDAGLINSFTAQEGSGGNPPMDSGFNEKKVTAENKQEVIDFFFQFNLHFWNRNWPEKIAFGHEKFARHAHGAMATLFYYQPGFRSGWVLLKEGMHANKDPKDQINPFPSMFVAIKGEAKGKIAGVEVVVKEGEAYFIPANVTHEFWAGQGQRLEGIILMFGEGA